MPDGNGMRARRVSSLERSSPCRPEATGGHGGLTLDWIGVQVTGGRGGLDAEGAGLFVALEAIRAAPSLVRRAARRLVRRRRPGA